MASIHFQCPSCRVELSAGKDQLGEPASCPDCGWTFYVPRDGGGDAGEVVKFFCPHCGGKLSATPDQFATEMPCPHSACGKPVLVPRPEWKSAPTTILKRGGDDPRGLVAEGEKLTRNREDGVAN